MGLRDIGATLPPGFKFYPSDEELVSHYLYKKIVNEQLIKGTLVEIDLHTCEPWQLPEVAKLNTSEWYFFSFRDRKYATGHRANRATASGYWKATGKDRMVVDQRTETVVGMRKTLVFYKSRAPNGIKTGWIMHEFRLENPHVPPKEDWVLCRVFHKAKSENNNELSSQNMFETNTSLNLATTPLTHDQTIPCSYHQLATFSQSPLYQKQYLNYPQLPRGSNEAVFSEMVNTTYEDDECGFFFDKTFKESSLGDNLPKNLEEVRFDDDNSVFL